MGRILRPGVYPIQQENAEVTYPDLADQVVNNTSDTIETITGIIFRRRYYYNAAGEIIQIDPWEVTNYPLITSVTPDTLIRGGNVALVIVGQGFGTDIDNVRVILTGPSERVMTNTFPKDVSLSPTLVTVVDTQISCIFDLAPKWAKWLDNGEAEIKVIRNDLLLESDPFDVTLVEN